MSSWKGWEQTGLKCSQANAVLLFSSSLAAYRDIEDLIVLFVKILRPFAASWLIYSFGAQCISWHYSVQHEAGSNLINWITWFLLILTLAIWTLVRNFGRFLSIEVLVCHPNFELFQYGGEILGQSSFVIFVNFCLGISFREKNWYSVSVIKMFHQNAFLGKGVSRVILFCLIYDIFVCFLST